MTVPYLLRFFLFTSLICSTLGASESILVCIAGGSGSGKTTVAGQIADFFDEDEVLVVSQDSYYKDLSHLAHSERAASNFDHPDSLDFGLLKSHLLALQSGNIVQLPVYDFVDHTRRKETLALNPRKIVIVEGILLLAMPELRELFDIKLYVDTDDDVRLLRRIFRDINERGRSLEGVSTQYLKTVRPMFLQFVEPSKRYADIIIPWGEHNPTAIDVVVSKLKNHLLKG